ncbi:MAG: hypothetical protein E6J88_17735 [Deltaproteobacteria bacterium]|nr:MAG: hypothetical protein E6J88_17735 [Deltaproteobacteria bacterium]
MPGLSPIKILGNLKFFSASLKLPTQGKADPAKEAWASKYHKDRDKADMGGAPEVIPPWFMPREAGFKPHQKSCDKIGQNFKDFHDAMIDAVQYSHNMWKLQAKFKDLQVMAVCAIGSPGCLDGPELESNIKNAPMVASFSGNMKKHRDAVAKGVSKCFKDWQGQVMVPGLPWYPAFAAFPGPMAPPMPNVPMPLITCVSSKMTSIIMPDDMTSAMDDALDSSMKDKDPDKQYHALHDAIATVLSLAFLMWLPMQQVMLVMGKGPIPTFAPPFVPVGPVVGGDNIAAPGHLMA